MIMETFAEYTMRGKNITTQLTLAGTNGIKGEY
jgi:hypothetical protein